MNKTQRIDILKNLFKGDKFAHIPDECTYRDLFEMVKLEMEGHGRAEFNVNLGPRPNAISALHRKMCNIRKKIERENLENGYLDWHVNI